MRKQIAILIMIMVGILSFIVGYSMSPSEIKTCSQGYCKKADVKAEKPVSATKKQEEEEVVTHKEKVEFAKPIQKVAPTSEKQPAESNKKASEHGSKEEIGGYGEEIGYGY